MMSVTKDNFAGDSRFYFPIGFAWMVLGALLLDKLPRHRLIRSPCFYSFVVPLLFNFVFYAGFGLFGHRPASMPNSGIYWLRRDLDQNHAAFLSRLIQERGKKPDLIVSQEDDVMLEVGVPFYWNYRNPDGPVYDSSRNLEIWAMIDPSEEQIFLSRFRKASSIDPVAVPPGFPFKFYILHYGSGNS